MPMTKWPFFRHLPAANKVTMNSKRYNRQIALPEIAISGQQKLASAKVLVVGAGGLGCPVLQNLAAAGVGHIGIVDGDVVEETNLHRQFLYSKDDCGKNKAVVAKDAILKQNPEINVVAYPGHFTEANAFTIAAGYHIMVDCTDNSQARYLINDVSLMQKVPMVYAAVHRFDGQLSVMNYKNGPSYRCLFPEKELLADNCNDVGVLGVVPNILGVLQSNEVLKIILGIGNILNGKLLVMNVLDSDTKTISFKKVETEITIGLQNEQRISNASNGKIGGLTASAFLTAIDDKKLLVIDLRESYQEPKLTFENVVQVPVSELENYLESIDKNRKVVLFCQHGQNSLVAAKYMAKMGFANVLHLENGIASLPENIVT